ncbi:Zinc finger C2HC5-type [Penicillium taxi]|uniref:Zinc finger C2HC5-type n=1 Tax=Penicillium taxi TaxID=168475 RepID=UPI0025453D7C|nr:Zinc finger C2HC5-type [Penicillium taxi]KAJ5894939.1 Zinc finger C2HC5-type [Penicillium taxi]
MSSIAAWALPRLGQLLPIDEESLSQIIDYSASLSKEACADHLKNLLGDSPAALEFISSFNARQNSRPATSSTPPVQNTQNNAPPSNNERPRGKKKKEKKPLHSAGPVRRPANYGDVGGGYVKADKEEDYMAANKRPSNPSLSAPGPFISSQSQSTLSAPTPKQPPSASGPLLSDMLPNVRSKTSKTNRNTGGSAGQSKGKGSITTNDISDLTAAIAALEVSTNPTLGTGQRQCSCYATIHPLFDPAPNCLNCGKIICSLEGLQPCSFCSTPLLSAEEVQIMIRELRAERGQEKMRAHNDGAHHDSGPKPTGSALATPNNLDAAKAHRDRLLQFQAQNARRTKVVDEAADFETPNVASTLWMSPAQRALALKKQQRIQREMEEAARPEWEKKKTVMSLDIKGGKVRRVYQSSVVESTPDVIEPDPVDVGAEGPSEGKGHAFSRNPLLAAGGLMRPVWRTPEAKAVDGVDRAERKQTWRRVQDDNEDNEQWILDGGVRGHQEEESI